MNREMRSWKVHSMVQVLTMATSEYHPEVHEKYSRPRSLRLRSVRAARYSLCCSTIKGSN